MNPELWVLKPGADKRLRSGHPWGYASEFGEIPANPRDKNARSVQVVDHRGSFIAFGYGNPQSQIAFRALSFNPVEKDFYSANFVIRKVISAWKRRLYLGMSHSMRLVFSENDELPGLIVDRYLCQRGQILVLQIATAGMEGALGDLETFSSCLIASAKGDEFLAGQLQNLNSAVVIRKDSSGRRMEGLKIEPGFVAYDPEKIMEEKTFSAKISRALAPSQSVELQFDPISGQKTGLFLDQSRNINILTDTVRRRIENFQHPQFRILDLCCYAGQWSAQVLAELLEFRKKSKKSFAIEVILADVAPAALHLAEKNLQTLGQGEHQLEIRAVLADISNDLPRFGEKYFDVVISDPPAFVKAKKDLPTGMHAYLKLNTMAFKMLRSGGVAASCSCSGLVKDAEFFEVLQKAGKRDSRLVHYIGKGGHAPDHPVLAGFPEGQYLKMYLHSVFDS